MSQTLNGNLMGSVSVLGLLDEEIKAEGLGGGTPNTSSILAKLESVAKAYDADGIFVVGQDGFIRSSWDSSGKPSTGLNVKFRPYYQMAMQRKENVYAAVSLARGDRSLYFTAPVLADKNRDGVSIGGVVARTNLVKIDALLKDKADVTLLLSPQGVVFAGNRSEWIGFMQEPPTSELLTAIRELKQFGAMFDKREPQSLPFSIDDDKVHVDGRRYAVARAQVGWNDPFGDWTLVMMEDLTRTVSGRDSLSIGAGAGIVVGILLLTLVNMMRSRHAQHLSAEQVAAFARAQQRSAERKAQLAGTALRLQQASSIPDLAAAFLTESHHLTGTLQGLVYVLTNDHDGLMCLAAGYAVDTGIPSEISLGEGLLGEVALTRVMRVIPTPPDGIWTIGSGLGNTRPRAVILAPILLNESLLGVVEVALLSPPDDETTRQFEELVGILALNLELVRRHEHIEERLQVTSAAEAAKSEQLAFQQVLIDSIPYPVFFLEEDTRIVGANKAYADTFGVRIDQLVGRKMTDLEFLNPADRAAYQSENEAIITAAGRTQRELRIAHADGSVHDALYFLSGFRRPDGSPGGLVGTFVDITQMKDAERELARLSDADRFAHLARGREIRILELKREVNALADEMGRSPPYVTELVEAVGDHEIEPHPDYEANFNVPGRSLQLADLVDLDAFQELFSNFCDVVGVSAAIIDLQANILASSRWQPACTDFHRVNPDSCARCIESDTELALKLKEGEDFTIYRCKNGLTDCASPIIVEGQHLANVFIGQFHVGPPDMDFFRNQAKQFGYDQDQYLKAVAAAPVMDEARLPIILGFLSGFAGLISTMSLARHRAAAAQQALTRQAVLLRQERLAAMSLAEDATRVHQAPSRHEGETQR
ncbi:PocR ligand-binding domain-containing protein [Magnetospirillum moscoviense]|uniref:PocR ligand-binding domain-containing protein n=1 Tax=Magnetospirillum moscoviense TaxID=1437059 RepID=UPI001FE0171E|nr:PocR ligand-binding domain-containing protein [Magnetospirillum moscoviense]